jgi:hypothetical protein
MGRCGTGGILKHESEVGSETPLLQARGTRLDSTREIWANASLRPFGNPRLGCGGMPTGGGLVFVASKKSLALNQKRR